MCVYMYIYTYTCLCAGVCVCDVWLIASEHLKKKVSDPWHLAFLRSLSSLSSLRKTADWSHEPHKPG